MTARTKQAVRDAGAVSLEYLVVGAVVIAIVTAALASGATGRYLVSAVQALICDASGGACDPVSPRDEDYRPDKCAVSSATIEQTTKVKVAFVRLGDKLTMMTTTNSDGSESVALLSDSDVGAEGKIGVEGRAQFGDLELSPALTAKAGGALTTQAGQTWNFASASDADRFRGELQRRFAEKVLGSFNPVGDVLAWGRQKLFGGDLPEPTVTTVGAGGKVYAKGEAGANIIGGAEGGAEIGTLLTVSTIDTGKGIDTEVAIKVDMKGTAAAEIFGAGVGGEKSSSGVLKIRRDAAGQPVSVAWVSTTKGSFEGTFTQPRGIKDALDLQKVFKAAVNGGGSDVAVVTTTLDLDTPERRRQFSDWESSFGDVAGEAASVGWDAMWGDGRGGLASGPFGDLVAEQGKTSLVSYTGDAFGIGLGAEGNLGIGAGLDVGGSSASTRATDAAYLGAPGADGSRELVPFLECVA